MTSCTVAAAFHEDVARYHDLHRQHGVQHADLEDELAAGGTVLDDEERHGDLVASDVPPLARPPCVGDGDPSPAS